MQACVRPFLTSHLIEHQSSKHFIGATLFHHAGVLGIWPSRAITFLDNHDTGSTLNHWPYPSRNLPEGYAYLLTHSGACMCGCCSTRVLDRKWRGDLVQEGACMCVWQTHACSKCVQCV